jgi:ribonuclease HI
MVTALKEALEMNFEEIEVISDSELMVKQINGEYQVKSKGLKPLYKEACELLKEFKKYTVRHVKREHNKEADKLANRGIDEALDEESLDL